MEARAQTDAAPVHQSQTNPAGFYPLLVGDTRTYLYTYAYQITWDDGRVDPWVIGTSTIKRQVACVSFQGEIAYYAESQRKPADSERIMAYSLLWQDAAGLHRRFQSGPPPCQLVPEVASAGAEVRSQLPGGGQYVSDQLVLAYPLHPGARWAPDPAHAESKAVVEGLDVVTVPAGRYVAWRIREAKQVPDDANDPARSWYSRDGYVKRAGTFHYSTPPSGPFEGNTVNGYYSEVLTSRTLSPD